MHSTVVRLATLALLCAGVLFPSKAQTPAPLHDGEGFALNHGVKIWYRVEGSAHADALPLLMIHGGPGATSRPFERTLGPALAKTRPVVYMDYRGTGRSDRPKDPAQYSYAILAEDAKALRETLGIRKWYVFGHSNGGATAMTYALHDSAHVEGMILCDPLLSPVDLEMNMVHKVVLAPPDKYEQARAAYRSEEDAETRFSKLLDLLDEQTRYGFQFFVPDSHIVLERIQAELGREIGKGLMEPSLMRGLIASGFFQFNAFALAPRLPLPVLILLGRFDSEISVENAMRFCLALPDGYAAVFDHSGHHPYLEETALCAQRITAFLAKHRGSGFNRPGVRE